MENTIIFGLLSAMWLALAILDAAQGNLLIAWAHGLASVVVGIVAMNFAFEYGRKRK